MEKLAIITLESSSIKLMITRINDDGYFKIIDEIVTPISTSEVFLTDKIFSQEILYEIEKVLINYNSLCINLKAEKKLTFATSIYNEIPNKNCLSLIFKRTLNSNLKYISIQDEAYYDYLNLSNSMYYKCALVINAAGYSTNISIIEDNKIVKTINLPIGSINVSCTYNLQDRSSKDDINNALTYIHKELLKLKSFKYTKYDSVYFIGDAIQCLSRIDRYKKKIPLTIAHNYNTTDIDISDIFNLVKSKSHLQRNRLEGMSSHLASTIVGGAAIIYQIISYFKITKFTISNRSLNDSIMFEYIDKNYKHCEDILNYSLNGMINELKINKEHAYHIYFLTLTLFNDLKTIHKLDDRYKKIIKAASLLHDSGTTVNYYNHHRHSFYLILNSYIDGLTHKELFLSACIAACHRNRNNYNFSFEEYIPFTNKNDFKIINKIGILLRIAESLDISMKSSITKITTQINDNSVILNLTSSNDMTLELIEVKKCIRKFKEIYDRNLIINIL